MQYQHGDMVFASRSHAERGNAMPRRSASLKRNLFRSKELRRRAAAQSVPTQSVGTRLPYGLGEYLLEFLDNFMSDRELGTPLTPLASIIDSEAFECRKLPCRAVQHPLM